MMKRLICAAGLLTSIYAPAAAQQRSADRDTIVVTATRLSATERALRDCLARHCKPNEDIDATLAHVENLFIAGDYQRARTFLLAARGRNRRFAAEYPVDVSDLLRVNSRVAAHLGDGTSYRLEAIAALDALKEGLSAEDPRVLTARLEVGDMIAQFNQIDAAVRVYQQVEKQAATLGLTDQRFTAAMRTALLYSRYALSGAAKYRDDAITALDHVIAETEARFGSRIEMAKVLRARLLARNGEAGAIDRLVADFQPTNGTQAQQLLYAAPIDATAIFNTGEFDSLRLTNRPFDDVDGQWIDVGFRIGPDGRVSDATVVRQGENVHGVWPAKIIAAINQRRYAPRAADAPPVSAQRLERYTLTSRWTTKTGSRLRIRSQAPQIEVLDLSES